MTVKIKLDPDEKGITITKKNKTGDITFGDTGELVVFAFGLGEDKAIVNDDFGEEYNVYIDGEKMERKLMSISGGGLIEKS